MRKFSAAALFYVFDGLLAALGLYAMDSLAHLRLSPKEFIFCWSAWPISLLLSRVLLRRFLARRWQNAVAAMVVGGILIAAIDRGVGAKLTAGEIIYAVLMVAVLIEGFFLVASRALAVGTTSTAEGTRLVLIGGAVVGMMAPMFTDLLIGGVDARWYAYMLSDFIAQFRSGAFPMIVGQGSFAYNGGVHPFRTAPYFHHWAALCDLFTWQVLTPLALEHLAVISSAFIGALGLYFVLVEFAPARRWSAMAVALIYVSSPAFLGVIYRGEAYMSYMTVAILPLVVYANLALVLRKGERPWIWLAIGLALLWFAHPGIAVFSSLASALIQGGRFLFEEQPKRAWWCVSGSALLFLLLSCFYFVSNLELPRSVQSPVFASAWQIAGAVVSVIGLTRGLVWNRRRQLWWLLAGLLMLLWPRPSWMVAMMVAALIAAIISAVLRRRARPETHPDAWGISVGSLILSGFITPLLIGKSMRVFNPDIVARMHTYQDRWAGLFDPRVNDAGVYQPGFGVVLLLGLVGWGATFGRSRICRFASVPIFLLLISCRPIPILSQFWGAHFPALLLEITDFPLDYRLLPPLVALSCGVGFVWLTCWSENRRRLNVGFSLVLLIAAAWSVAQSWTYVRAGFAVTSVRSQTDKLFRPENRHLDRFAYDRMFMPRYYSDGASDPRLESRLLDSIKRVAVGPDQTARLMETYGQENLNLTSTVSPSDATWLTLSPTLTLKPGEHVLLRFSFLLKNYRGWLIFNSTNIYREYMLPDSGWYKAFGSNPGRSRVISLWNSGKAEEHVELSFKRSGPGSTGEFGDFGSVTVSHYDPSKVALKTESLDPYRVTLDAPQAGWLETPRLFLPGYTARVDGQPAAVLASPDHLVMVPVAPGAHLVEVKFRGSGALWVAWIVSAISWIAVLVFLGKAFGAWLRARPVGMSLL